MLKKISLLIALAVICLAVAAAGLYHASWRFRHEVDVVRRIGPGNISIRYDSGGQRVSFLSDGLNIVGDLRQAGHGDARPGIVLLHGSSPWGRRLALYRLLAGELCSRGYVVLTIDVRGFGESDDPVSLTDLQALDGSRDVIRAINFLSSSSHVDADRISLVGHSMGGGLAIKAGIGDTRVRKIIAIGPPRRVRERIDQELSDWRSRFSHDRRFDRQVPLDVVRRLLLSSEDHPAIFLIDGEWEDPRDQWYLSGFYEQIQGPKRYVTMKGTGHYLSTAGFFGCPIVLYDARILRKTVDEIDAWLRD